MKQLLSYSSSSISSILKKWTNIGIRNSDPMVIDYYTIRLKSRDYNIKFTGKIKQ